MALPFGYQASITDINFAFEAAGVWDERFNVIPEISHLRAPRKKSDDATDYEAGQLILKTAKELAEGEFLPLYENTESATYNPDTHVVKLPKGYKEAHDKYVASGLQGVAASTEHGGMGLPKALDAAIAQILFAANNAFALGVSLTKSVRRGLVKNAKDAEPGNEEGKLPTRLRDIFVENLTSGKWPGLIVITEKETGSDLSLTKTQALKNDDGSYRITGEKIFITGGDNDFSTPENNGNIIHLVLVRIGDDKELSLMAVPKYLVNEEEKIGEANKVYASGLWHKMGAEHSATVTLQYEGAKGWLVGERGKGIAAMIGDVINDSRRTIGRENLGIADIAAQNSLKYARNDDGKGRRMGRAMHGHENPEQPADSIIVHPGVRTMLLHQQAFVQGARVLDLLTELEADVQDKESQQWVSLLTNMQKYQFTEEGFEVANRAVQIFGGAGYIKELGVERLVRDARVPEIYEGTNQVQATTLVGRQLPNLVVFEKRVREFTDRIGENDYTKPLLESLNELMESSRNVESILGGDKNAANAVAETFIKLFGTVAIGYGCARSAALAQEKLKTNPPEHEKAFYEGKLETARFYMNMVLKPHIKGQHTIITPDIMDYLEMTEAGIRRQNVPPVQQYAATNVTGIQLPEGITKEGIAKARIAGVNQEMSDALPEAKKRDMLRMLYQLGLDLAENNPQNQRDPEMTRAIKTELLRLKPLNGIIQASLLHQFLAEKDKDTPAIQT